MTPAVLSAVTALGWDVQEIAIPRRPRRLTGRDGVRGLLQHTDDTIVRSWDLWFELERASQSGDVLVVSDVEGVGLVPALQSRAGSGRRVVVVAGESKFLEAVELADVRASMDAELGPVLDIERQALWAADEVVTLSPWVADVLATEGVHCRLVTSSSNKPSSRLMAAPAHVHLPEPPSRSAATGIALRAVAAAREAGRDVTASLDVADVADGIWMGTGWEALSGVRDVLGTAVERLPSAPDDSTFVLGSRRGLPDDVVAAAIEAGRPAFVRSGGVAAARWPHLPTWEAEADLAVLLVDGGRGSPRTPGARRQQRKSAGDRANRISVGIPVFRDVRFLDDCLDSLLDQTVQVAEVIIVDDGSGSRDVDLALERAVSRDPDRVRVLRQSNRGVCVARNSALEAMSGDAFLLVDQDDLLAPSFVERCQAVLRDDGRVTAAATWTEFFGTYNAIEAKLTFDARTGRRENTIVSTCVLVDMAVRDAGIRFDPDLSWIYCEDWDFWSRIVAAGGTFGLVPEPLARHRVHPASGGHRRTDLALALGKARATSHLDRIDRDGPLAPPVTAP